MNRKCLVTNCINFVGLHGARGLCPLHYKRIKTHGTTEKIIKEKKWNANNIPKCFNCDSLAKAYPSMKLCQKCYHRKYRFGTFKRSVIDRPDIILKRNNKDLFRIWKGMMDRAYYHYKGVSRNYEKINVSKEWTNFTNFYKDMNKGFKKGLSLDRIDTTKGYHKNNCRWATVYEQSINKINTVYVNYKNKKIALLELCKKLNKNYKSVYPRYKRTGDIEFSLYSKLWSKQYKNQ